MKLKCALGLLACLFANGCGLFVPKPVLPQHSAAEGEIEQANELDAALRHADIVYFPLEALGHPSNDQSAWKIVEAVRRNRALFAIAWPGVEVDQQPLLDELTAQHGEPREPLAQMWGNYAAEMREQCKTILHVSTGIPQLALGCPRIVYGKLQSGETLHIEEKALIPRDFHPAAGGLEEFAEQIARAGNLPESEIAKLYRAYLFAQQFAAEKIVRFMHDHRNTKLLVFLRRRELNGKNSLPNFVRQKLSVRQISFDLDHGSGDAPAHLLTLASVRERALSRF